MKFSSKIGDILIKTGASIGFLVYISVFIIGIDFTNSPNPMLTINSSNQTSQQ